MPNKKYIPSNSIKKRITEWEGSSMLTNRSFDLEAADFLRRLEMAKIYDLMSQDELDALFSYSYNVGSTTFAKRTIPHLVKLYNGTGTLNNVLNNIYGTKDKTLPGLRKRRDIERQLFKDAYNRRTSLKKTPKAHVYLFPQEIDRPQQELNSVPSYAWNPSIVLQKPENQQISEPQNSYTIDVRYPTRKRIESLHTGGRLIKRGQYGTPLYHKTLYLEKDGDEQESPHKELKSWIPDITPEERMDLTVQQLSNGLSTYLPTKEQKQASEGIYHPKRITDWLGLAPVVLPATIAAGVTLPEWGPTVLTTASNPTFWGELLKDTGVYVAADAASLGLTGKGIGAHVNNVLGLEEEHPVGELIGFGGTSILRRPILKLGRKAYETIRGTIQPEYALSRAMNLTLLNPYISREIGENGKIRLRLPSHTNEAPKEIVLDPQGNNKFYVHVRTWNDIDGKIPANLTPREIGYLYEALYDELPDGAEILFPKSGPGNYATRGTVAALQRLARDPRYIKGAKGKLLYIDKDGSIKKFKGTSFLKKVTHTNEDYITRQLIPFAKLQGNWVGHNNVTSNILDNIIPFNDEFGSTGGVFVGNRDAGKIFVNTGVLKEHIDPILLHEIRHAYDYWPKYGTVGKSNPITRFLRSDPRDLWSSQDQAIKLTDLLLELLNRAYPHTFRSKLKGWLQGNDFYKINEKVAVNAELRKMLDNYFIEKYNKVPSVNELNTFIQELPDVEFFKILGKMFYRSPYMETYLRNISKSIPGTSPRVKINVYPKTDSYPALNIGVRESVLTSDQIKLIRQALTSVPSMTGIGYGIHNIQQTQ